MLGAVPVMSILEGAKASWLITFKDTKSLNSCVSSTFNWLVVLLVTPGFITAISTLSTTVIIIFWSFTASAETTTASAVMFVA